MTPVEASRKVNEKRVERNLYGRRKRDKQRPNMFKIGDEVRIAKAKHHFEKGYTPNWAEEVFVIDQILPTYPVTYRIHDLADEPLVGSFYEQQLQKTTQNTFHIEKVLRKRKEKVLLKWKGYEGDSSMYACLGSAQHFTALYITAIYEHTVFTLVLPLIRTPESCQ